MDSSRVSVCIPVYNRAELVRGAIQSALEQDHAPLEIIVVDNCSTDDTWSVLQTFQDHRLHIVRNNQNLGMMGNFNRCLELARGAFVRILCSDDRLEPDTIAREAQIMVSNPGVAVLSTLGQHADQHGRLQQQSAPLVPPGIYSGRRATWLTLWCLANYGANPFNFPSGVLLRRDAAMQAGRFDESLHGLADVDFWLRTLEHGDACFSDHFGCTVLEHGGRESMELFWKGLYMRGHFELVCRRAHMFQDPHNRLGPMITQLGGRCLWYAVKSVLHGRRESAAIHRRLLREYGVAVPPAAWALVGLAIQRLRRRFHEREDVAVINQAMERAFQVTTADLPRGRVAHSLLEQGAA